MTKKKITVVSIDENNDNNGDIVANNEVASPEPQGHAITTLESIVEEPIIEEQVIETKTECVGGTASPPKRAEDPLSVKQQALPLVRQTPTVEDKILRTNELIKCPKCDKLVTEKTLKYSHKKTCSGEEDKTTPERYNTVKPAKIPEDVPLKSVPPSPPKLVRTVSRIREVIDTAPNQITPEMMREYRNNMRTERIKMRSDEMKSLFTNGI